MSTVGSSITPCMPCCMITDVAEHARFCLDVLGRLSHLAALIERLRNSSWETYVGLPVTTVEESSRRRRATLMKSPATAPGFRAECFAKGSSPNLRGA